MNNVVQFRQRSTYPENLEPDVTIHIYERPEHGGFDWVVTGAGDPPTREQLSDYLGDMFLSLHPEADADPSIFQRTATFFSNLFHPYKG